jgi:hypothetical protein
MGAPRQHFRTIIARLNLPGTQETPQPGGLADLVVDGHRRYRQNDRWSR